MSEKTLQTLPGHSADTLVVILARGGSKGLPGKNMRTINGETLIARCINTCFNAKRVVGVIVSTDCWEIEKEATLAGAIVVHRPDHLARDDSTSEAGLIHAVNVLNERLTAPLAERYPIIAMVQCTAPLMTSEDIDRTVASLKEWHDMSVAVVEDHSFLVDFDEDGYLNGVGFDIRNPITLRQHRARRYNVAGSIWAMWTDQFLRHGKLYGGFVTGCVVPGPKLDIDTAEDLKLAELILGNKALEGAVDPYSMVLD